MNSKAVRAHALHINTKASVSMQYILKNIWYGRDPAVKQLRLTNFQSHTCLKMHCIFLLHFALSDINDCGNQCKNGARCIDLVNDYKCDCLQSMQTGKNCDKGMYLILVPSELFIHLMFSSTTECLCFRKALFQRDQTTYKETKFIAHQSGMQGRLSRYIHIMTACKYMYNVVSFFCYNK